MEYRNISKPIIIVGAGIVGLALAQSLKQEGIPFELYERDETLDQRSPGWGITINWALEALENCLPKELFAGIDARKLTLNRDAKVPAPTQTLHYTTLHYANNTGRFLFLDLETLKPRYTIPPSPRKRLNRSKFRALLATGLDIHWGKSLASFAPDANGAGIVATFADGTAVHGAMLVAADGGNSRTRTLLLGEEVGALHQLPARFMGVTATFSADQMKPLLAVDPLLFQGTHPGTGYFLWFAVVSTPETNVSAATLPVYEVQVNLSWIFRGPGDEVPAESERLARMKAMVRKGSGFHGVLRRMVLGIPEGTPVREIKLADWPTVKWNGGGLVTLLGDAAHAMTMYRGEASNHGFTDAKNLKEQLKLWYAGLKTQGQALDDYQNEMYLRTRPAVLLSRQACLDAHDLANLGPDSPLVSRRARVLDRALKA
ncbi:hypothetical protein E0Z10_g4727 [Xylaria hypoxylon]|uniref:FAD-binding domain-containing protein n=1 Tax=Xylaria hypoxylon TaxID=37992 RepID=A0A4Z0YKF2_9PEZI|nr:hypothetical protein E0Z10_g4727 [Xylaria hypoxylon]